MTATIRLQREPFDAAAEAAELRRGRTDIGALVTFTGVCRAHEGDAPLVAMTLEHYPGMAEAEVGRHVEAAEQRWPLNQTAPSAAGATSCGKEPAGSW